MKIGIITFQCAHNYGAVLQAYALKEYLKTLGYSVNIINYRPRYIVNAYKKNNLRNWLSRDPYKCIIRLFIELIVKPIRIKRWYAFENFMNRYLDLHPYKRNEDFSEYNVLVLGSDQIWNPGITGGKFDGVYFGNDAKCKIVSYAASSRFEKLSKQQKDFFSNALQKIEHISVREDSLASLLQPLIDKEIKIVIDPTLLAGRRIFDKIAIPSKKNKYLLLYQIGQWKELNRLAVKIAKKLNLEIIEITSHPIIPKSGLIQTASPSEFIGYFQNASFVVTTSFHGLAFALTYNKEFYCLKQKSNSDLRLLSLLNKLDLDNRCLEIGEEPNFEVINYSKVNEKLNREVELSLKYLEIALN